jgi:hypothetical protein
MIGVTYWIFVVEVVVAGSVDPMQLLGGSRLLEGSRLTQEVTASRPTFMSSGRRMRFTKRKHRGRLIAHGGRKRPRPPELAVLVGELAVQDADFRTWWATHQVTGAGDGTKHYRHLIVGDLTSTAKPGTAPMAAGNGSWLSPLNQGPPRTKGCAFLPHGLPRPQPSNRSLRPQRRFKLVASLTHDRIGGTARSYWRWKGTLASVGK